MNLKELPDFAVFQCVEWPQDGYYVKLGERVYSLSNPVDYFWPIEDFYPSNRLEQVGKAKFVLDEG